MPFDPANYEGQDRLSHIEKYLAVASSSSLAVKFCEYLIVPTAAGGAQAINGTTGNVDFSTTSTTDHAPVFQSAINALAVQNGGKGGGVAFKGQFVWNSQVILYPGISLMGEDPVGNKSVQNTGSSIQSNVNGDTLVIPGVTASNRYFPGLRNFTLWGHTTMTNQNLIRFDNSAGDVVQDAFLTGITLFNAGKNGIYIDSTASTLKIWLDDCYLESCVLDGVQQNGGTLAIQNSYLFGNGNGARSLTGNGAYMVNNRFWNNVSTGFSSTAGMSELVLSGNSFDTNGTNASGTPQAFIMATSVAVNGNVFSDTRGASAVLYNMRVSFGGTIFHGAITGNSLFGAQTQNIQMNYSANNVVTIADNVGWNDSFGKIASPFQGTHMSMEAGGTAAPTASTDYVVVGTPLYCNFAGGTGVSISIKDPAGNTISSGLTTFTGPLSPGYKINFGAFSVAPATVYVGVT